MTQTSQKKIETDKWWNNLSSFEKKELYKYWEGKE